MFAEFGLSAPQEFALAAHLDLLMRWNQKINLTAIRDRQEAIERHYWESLFLGARLPAGQLRIVDVGSGAGFPGFPVAIMRPDCLVTLVESHQRKAAFLKEAARGVGNVRVVARRAENLGERFDWSISRAVGYEELGRFLKDLAPNAELLGGGERPPVEMGFEWEAPLQLPWGLQRFLWTGHEG